jgi:hypothetical protein
MREVAAVQRQRADSEQPSPLLAPCSLPRPPAGGRFLPAPTRSSSGNLAPACLLDREPLLAETLADGDAGRVGEVGTDRRRWRLHRRPPLTAGRRSPVPAGAGSSSLSPTRSAWTSPTSTSRPSPRSGRTSTSPGTTPGRRSCSCTSTGAARRASPSRADLRKVRSAVGRSVFGERWASPGWAGRSRSLGG